MREERLTRCYADESVHSAAGFVVTAFVFASVALESAVAAALRKAGFTPKVQEFKSSGRMDSNPPMRALRDDLLAIAASKTKIAAFFGPYDRNGLGKHSLQALQSTLVRNGIAPSRLNVYFDADMFPSSKEAARLQRLFGFLRGARLHPREDSRCRLGIQVADAVANSLGRILKEEISGTPKIIDIGSPNSGYAPGTTAPLGWSLLMGLRYGFMTRPVAYRGDKYSAATDPVVLDPARDDPVNYLNHPILLGWGVQVAPESDQRLHQAVARVFGRIWRGCIH